MRLTLQSFPKWALTLTALVLTKILFVSILMISSRGVRSFQIHSQSAINIHARSFRLKSTKLFSSFNPQTLRRDIKVPLLDVPDPTDGEQEEHQPLVIVPLPSDHLPSELRDLNIYGMELSRPVHKLIIQDAVQRAESSPLYNKDVQQTKPIYGHLAWKPDSDSLVGAIGCITEVLLQADGDGAAAMMGGGMDKGALETQAQSPSDRESLPKTVVCSGAFRFVVKEVTQTVPFPIAIVDELVDEEPGSATTRSDSSSTAGDINDEDDEEADDDGMYDDMSPTDMIQALFQDLQAYVDQKVQDAAKKEMSPLEQAILEDTGIPGDPVATEQTRAEQMAAVLIAFRTTLVDICTTAQERYFAVAMMAAEIVVLENPVRRKMLQTVNGLQRLKFVLKEVKQALGMARARKMAEQITDTSDESSKDLKVSVKVVTCCHFCSDILCELICNSLSQTLQIGKPELPPWSKQLRKGMKISYYWNEGMYGFKCLESNAVVEQSATS